MCCIVVSVTGLWHMLLVFAARLLFTGYEMRSPACTLNCVIAVMLLGIRQNFFESKLVTPIPMNESTLKVPFKVCVEAR